MDKAWKVILAFIGVFIAGAVFGGLFTLRFERPAPVPAAPIAVQDTPKATPPAPSPATTGGQVAVAQAPAVQQQSRIAPVFMRQFTQRLNPTPDQKKKIGGFVARASDDLQRLQREHLQDTTRVTERMYEDVSSVLSTEQRTQLEKMRQEMLERVRKEREKRGELQAKGSPARPGATPPAARQPGTVEGSNPPGKD